MGIQYIESEEGLERAKGSGLTLVDFGAPWCAPCRLQEPIIRRLAAQFEGKASMAAVNITENGDLASRLGIQSIPTLILFRNGKELQRFVGLQSKATLSDALEKFII